MTVNSLKTNTAKPKETNSEVKVKSVKPKTEMKPKESVEPKKIRTISAQSKNTPRESAKASLRTPVKTENKDTIKKTVTKDQTRLLVNRVNDVTAPKSNQQPTIKKSQFQYTNKIANRRSRPMSKQPTVRKMLTEKEKEERKTARSTAVRRAWALEKKLVELGGGSRNWTQDERKIILSGKRVPSYEGHHIRNVADHNLRFASDPRNIVFIKDEQHDNLHKLGDATTGNLIDREEMIQKAEQYLNQSNRN